MQGMAGSRLGPTWTFLRMKVHGAQVPTHVPDTDDAQPLNAVRLGNGETPGQSRTKVMPHHLAPAAALRSDMLQPALA